MSTDSPAPTFVLERRVAEAVAREAGLRMLAGARRGFEVEVKGINDVVTTVDRSVERFVRAAISEAFPEDAFFGEEYGVVSEGERRWVVDPIDGTLNFSRRIPVFCVSIALQVGRESVVGVIYEPNRDELFVAVKGQGAWLNGQSMSVSECGSLSESVLATGFPPMKEGDRVDNIEHFSVVAKRCRNVRRLGSAAVDLAYVACGRLDGFWEFNLNPWDTSAGYLLVSEAGGRATSLEGAPYHGYAPCVVATNSSVHDELLESLAGVGEKL